MKSLAKLNAQANFIPNQLQHWLLKAALAEKTAAAANWQLLKINLGIDGLNLSEVKPTLLAVLYDKLDSASTRLLPMIYKNLHHLQDPLLQSIKSYYHYNWARNHYLLAKVKTIVATWPATTLMPLWLKGLAIAFCYAEDPGIRVMDDVDILINPHLRQGIINELAQSFALVRPFCTNAVTLQLEKFNLDLHWQLFDDQDFNVYQEKNYSRICQNALFAGNILNPTLNFFHVIMHGIRPNKIAPIRWISDCYLISLTQAIDWSYLLQLALRLHGVERLRIACEILPHYAVLVPEAIIDQLQQLPLNLAQINYLNSMRVETLAECGLLKVIYNDLRHNYWQHKVYRKHGQISFVLNLPKFIFKRLQQVMVVRLQKI